MSLLLSGFDGVPDFVKALNFCRAPEWEALMAVMYFNGEGTARDLNKAEAVLSQWKKKDQPEFNPDQAAIIQKAIDQCRRNGQKSCPRLDYCNDLAEATLDLEICDAAQQLTSESSFRRSLAQVKTALSTSEAARFDQVVANFKLYQDQEAGRSYDALGNGTTRGLAGNGQAAFVRENFLRLIHETIESRKLQPVTTASYEQIAHEADQEYRRDLQRTVSFQREELKDPTRKRRWAEDRSQIEEYGKAAQESQAQWLRFRDSCADLASALYRDQSGSVDPAVSMKAAVTKTRVTELRYNPIGPQDS